MILGEEEGAKPGDRITATLDELKKTGRVGIMTHIVLGYPSLEESHQIVDCMVRSGVDLIEVQIPFSDPTADGPVITEACQAALDGGVRVADAMKFMSDVSARHDIPFLFMSYVNIAFGYKKGAEFGGGFRSFVKDAADAGATGLIIPDMPPEMKEEGYTEACREFGVHPVFVVSPNEPEARLELIKQESSGFLYSTSRTGTTGREMELALGELREFLALARRVVGLPLAVGFSISKREHIDALASHADIAVIGSHFIRAYRDGGLAGLEAGLKSIIA